MKFKGIKYLFWILPLAVGIFFSAVYFANLISGNFHVVLPQKLYRSAQLNAETLNKLIPQYRIKTIINMRGPHPQEAWYNREIRISENHHAMHYDVKTDAHGLVSHAELKQLIAILQQARFPILVHCNQGADRSGLASAIGLILFSNATKTEILKQASWRYNVYSPSSVGYEVLQNYLRWLDRQHGVFGKTSFLKWVNSSMPLQHYHGAFL